MKLPTQEYLKECFHYDTAEGKLIWKERPRSHFSSHEAHVRWNSKWAKKLALNYLNSDRVFTGMIDYSPVFTDRVIYKLHTGKEPETLYHLNGKMGDNRISNLSDAPDTPIESPPPSNSFVLCWSKEKQVWAVHENTAVGRKKEYSPCREFSSKQEALAYKNNRDREALCDDCS